MEFNAEDVAATLESDPVRVNRELVFIIPSLRYIHIFQSWRGEQLILELPQ